MDPQIRPFGVRVLVKPEEVEQKTDGGIYIPETVMEKDKFAVMIGTLVGVGEIAFTDPDWLDKPKVGDTIIYDRYSGATVTGKDGEEYKLMNDDDIGGKYE